VGVFNIGRLDWCTCQLMVIMLGPASMYEWMSSRSGVIFAKAWIVDLLLVIGFKLGLPHEYGDGFGCYANWRAFGLGL
jgi:hypothetical protein